MTKPFIFFLLTVFAVPFSTLAQKEPLPRSPLQQRYLLNTILLPQIKKGRLAITQELQVDSLFQSWEKAWKTAAPDSMKANPTAMNRTEFDNLDAYCYFWGLASISGNLSVDETFADILVRYMGASLQRDLTMLRRIPRPEIIDQFQGGNLGNTLSIGSSPKASRQAFQATYALYSDYKSFFESLKDSPDTAVSRRAQQQLKKLAGQYYAMNARHSFYQGNTDAAFTYFVTGLSVNNYSKTRAIDLGKKLYKQFATAGEQDKAYALLNAVALNTTPDNLNRDTLASWYADVDAVAGPKAYLDLKSKLSLSAFKTAGSQVKLPLPWSFIANALPPGRLASAKYILFDFWFTSCGPCLEEIPELNAFYEKMKDRPDVLFISVNTDYKNGKNPPAFVEKRTKELNIGYPVYYDDAAVALANQFGITGYPTKMIVSINGEKIVKTDLSPVSTAAFQEFLKEKN